MSPPKFFKPSRLHPGSKDEVEQAAVSLPGLKGEGVTDCAVNLASRRFDVDLCFLGEESAPREISDLVSSVSCLHLTPRQENINRNLFDARFTA
jgi:hypothetical protein